MPAVANRPITYVRPWVYPKQHDAIFCDERYALVEASTKSGKTVGCLIWFAEHAMAGKAGQNFWWVAPSFSQAKMAWSRMRHAIPREIAIPKETELTLRLVNGAMLWFKTGEKPDLLYGEDVYAAVVDILAIEQVRLFARLEPQHRPIHQPERQLCLFRDGDFPGNGVPHPAPRHLGLRERRRDPPEVLASLPRHGVLGKPDQAAHRLAGLGRRFDQRVPLVAEDGVVLLGVDPGPHVRDGPIRYGWHHRTSA